MCLNEFHGHIHEDARRLTVTITNDLAADRVRCVLVDARELEGVAVGPAGMPVDSP